MIERIFDRDFHIGGRPRSWSVEQAREAVLAYLRGEGTLRELERRYGVPSTTIHYYVQKARQNAGAIPSGGRGINLDEGRKHFQVSKGAWSGSGEFRTVQDGFEQGEAEISSGRSLKRVQNRRLKPPERSERYQAVQGCSELSKVGVDRRVLLWGAGLLGAGLLAWRLLGLKEMWREFREWRKNKRNDSVGAPVDVDEGILGAVYGKARIG